MIFDRSIELFRSSGEIGLRGNFDPDNCAYCSAVGLLISRVVCGVCSLLPRWRVARWRLLFAVKGLTLSLVRESEFVKYFLISIVYTDAQLPLGL
jgi:hypothetical protein